MAAPAPSPQALRIKDLSQSDKTPFALIPDAEERTTLAASLDLLDVRKLRFEGNVAPAGPTDWHLDGRLGATVVQPCVATLEPVTTRIEARIVRQFVKDYAEPEELEAEMPEDDTVEPLGEWIDLSAVLQEALALSVPDYPRKEDAEVGQMIYTRPGETPMTDEAAKPFAGLADLKRQLDAPDDGNSG